MNLIETLIGNSAVGSIAGKLGLDSGMAQKALSSVLPKLEDALKTNASSDGGMDSLANALNAGSHDEYVNNPDKVVEDDSTIDGNKILGHLLGSKDKSREVAKAASEESGIDFDVLKKLLPMAATLAMGGLSKAAKSETGMDAIKGVLKKLL